MPQLWILNQVGAAENPTFEVVWVYPSQSAAIAALAKPIPRIPDSAAKVDEAGLPPIRRIALYVKPHQIQQGKLSTISLPEKNAPSKVASNLYFAIGIGVGFLAVSLLASQFLFKDTLVGEGGILTEAHTTPSAPDISCFYGDPPNHQTVTLLVQGVSFSSPPPYSTSRLFENGVNLKNLVPITQAQLLFDQGSEYLGSMEGTKVFQRVKKYSTSFGFFMNLHKCAMLSLCGLAGLRNQFHKYI